MPWAHTCRVGEFAYHMGSSARRSRIAEVAELLAALPYREVFGALGHVVGKNEVAPVRLVLAGGLGGP